MVKAFFLRVYVHLRDIAQFSLHVNVKVGLIPSVPSKPKKTSTFGTFFGHQPTKIKKTALANLDAISSTGENFTTKVRYFFKNVRNIFSRFKPFSGHNMDIQQ